MIDLSVRLIYHSRLCGKALLRGYKKALDVIPWLDHGIYKSNLKY
ncbi:MAG: hypothetical protein ACEY3D_08165 [Rickettsia sp.]